MYLVTDEDAAAWRQWAAAVADDDRGIGASISDFYKRLDAEVAQRPGVCEISGRCCRFEQYGHRLYVTGLETAWLLRQLDDAGRQHLEKANLPGDAVLDEGCPFQQQQLCTVHTLRPLGCRIFFCDPAADAWQNDLYEQFLNELRQLHERHHLPYRYLEWRAALAEGRAVLG